MGLDMYLKAEKHASGYDFSDDKEMYSTVVNAIGAEPFADKETPSVDITVMVGYWRKANAIHGWFVRECQEGVDECQQTWIPREKLKDLMELCKAVLADKTRAEELLPVTEGFFFGGYEYDEWYFTYLKNTVEMLNKVLKNLPEDWDIYYRSSW
jgi:hypothetical protein